MLNKFPLQSITTTLSQTKQLHALLTTTTSSSTPSSVLSTIITSYSSHQDLLSARTLFLQTRTRSTLLYNTLIRAHARTRNFPHASSLFARLRNEPEPGPDCFTFSTLLRACSDNSDPTSLRALHSLLLSSGFASHLVPAATLVRSYSTLGLSADAANVFDEMPHPDLVLYNAMLSGFGHGGKWRDALDLFNRMRAAVGGQNPDGFSLVGLLSCFLDPSLIMPVGAVHGFVLKAGFESNSHVTSVLVSVYSRLGCPEYSYLVFKEVPCPDLVTWSAVITGFSRAGRWDDALDLFKEMNGGSTRKPDSVLIASVVSACASLAAVRPGKEVHGYVLRTGMDLDVAVSSALVDLYSKCGFVEHGYLVFDMMSNKNSVAYNSAISGLGANGFSREALRVFDEMLEDGCEPDEATFSGVLCACAHSGLLEEGTTLFRRMRYEFGIEAKMEHYVYMVKLMGLVGKLDEALELIEGMPELPGSYSGVWGALLWGCGLHGRTDLREIAGRSLFEMDPGKGAYRVMISNMYASEEKWVDVESMRDGMMVGDVKKVTGVSWIGDCKG